MLSARKSSDAALFKALEVDYFKRLLYFSVDFALVEFLFFYARSALFVDICAFRPLKPQPEGDIFVNVEVGEERIFLEYGIYGALVGG